MSSSKKQRLSIDAAAGSLQPSDPGLLAPPPDLLVSPSSSGPKSSFTASRKSSVDVHPASTASIALGHQSAAKRKFDVQADPSDSRPQSHVPVTSVLAKDDEVTVETCPYLIPSPFPASLDDVSLDDDHPPVESVGQGSIHLEHGGEETALQYLQRLEEDKLRHGKDVVRNENSEAGRPIDLGESHMGGTEMMLDKNGGVDADEDDQRPPAVVRHTHICRGVELCVETRGFRLPATQAVEWLKERRQQNGKLAYGVSSIVNAQRIELLHNTYLTDAYREREAAEDLDVRIVCRRQAGQAEDFLIVALWCGKRMPPALHAELCQATMLRGDGRPWKLATRDRLANSLEQYIAAPVDIQDHIARVVTERAKDYNKFSDLLRRHEKDSASWPAEKDPPHHGLNGLKRCIDLTQTRLRDRAPSSSTDVEVATESFAYLWQGQAICLTVTIKFFAQVDMAKEELTRLDGHAVTTHPTHPTHPLTYASQMDILGPTWSKAASTSIMYQLGSLGQGKKSDKKSLSAVPSGWRAHVTSLHGAPLSSAEDAAPQSVPAPFLLEAFLGFSSMAEDSDASRSIARGTAKVGATIMPNTRLSSQGGGDLGETSVKSESGSVGMQCSSGKKTIIEEEAAQMMVGHVGHPSLDELSREIYLATCTDVRDLDLSRVDIPGDFTDRPKFRAVSESLVKVNMRDPKDVILALWRIGKSKVSTEERAMEHARHVAERGRDTDALQVNLRSALSSAVSTQGHVRKKWQRGLRR